MLNYTVLFNKFFILLENQSKYSASNDKERKQIGSIKLELMSNNTDGLVLLPNFLWHFRHGNTSSKRPSCQCRRCKNHGYNPWVRKILWKRKWQLPPVFWPGELHGQRSLAGYSPWGHKKSDKMEWLSLSLASLTQWTWIWANCGRQWRIGKPGMLQSMGSQRVGHNLVTEQQQCLQFACWVKGVNFPKLFLQKIWLIYTPTHSIWKCLFSLIFDNNEYY